MRRGRHVRSARSGSWSLHQLVTGLVALPLSLLPFVGYLSLTPEGRLVRDRALVAMWPPSLPTLTARQVSAASEAAPTYNGSVMALAYHGIGSASDAEGGFVISPGRFAEHLATLKAAGMRSVTAAQVASAFTGGPALPEKAVMISFDDGRTDAMMFADPLLADAGMSATMFVITGAAEEPGIYYASWDKLEAYARSGRWDLQAHTAQLHREVDVAGGGSLPALTSVRPRESLAEYRARVRDDLGQASGAIARHTGRRPVAFAYPFGAYGADRTNHPGIRRVLKEEVKRRYSVAFHQDEQETIPLLTGDEDLLGLRRLEVQDWSGMELLKRIDSASRHVSRPGRPAIQSPEAANGRMGASVPTTVPEQPPSSMLPGVPPVPSLTGPRPGTGTRRPTLPTRTVPIRPGTILAPTATVPSLAMPTAPTPPPATSPTTIPPPTTTPTTAAPTPSTTLPTAPATTPTTTPTTVTTQPTTTTTTEPRGCRSRGEGKVCGHLP